MTHELVHLEGQYCAVDSLVALPIIVVDVMMDTVHRCKRAMVSAQRYHPSIKLRGASEEELSQILGRARAKKGMFEGDLNEGELEIGQVSALIRDVLPVRTIIENIMSQFLETVKDPFRNSIKRN